MTKVIDRMLGLLRFARVYRNPLHIMLSRRRPAGELMKVVDRSTGIACHCTVGSYRMFREVWGDKSYDIPKLPIRPGDVVIDIGANQGFYTCYAAHQGAKVYAFEPFPTSYETLVGNIELNEFSSRVTAHPWALAAENGSAEMYFSEMLGGGMNSINKTFAEGVNLDRSRSLPVPCYTLPHVLSELKIERVRICKLDCEGAELEILRTLTPAHLACIDAFVIEYHPEAYRMRELLDLILGWKTYQVAFGEDTYYSPAILRAVSNKALTSAFS